VHVSAFDHVALWVDERVRTNGGLVASVPVAVDDPDAIEAFWAA
jgi:hypothetical protein